MAPGFVHDGFDATVSGEDAAGMAAKEDGFSGRHEDILCGVEGFPMISRLVLNAATVLRTYFVTGRGADWVIVASLLLVVYGLY